MNARDRYAAAAHSYETMLPRELSREQERILDQTAARATKDLDRAASGVGEDVAALLTDEELWTVLAAWLADPKSGHRSAIDARARARELREIARERYVEQECERKSEEF